MFNIAAKSDGITGMSSTIDPVLSIFLKVFNEMLGYDPLNPEIAEVERHLESINQYDFSKLNTISVSTRVGRKDVNLYF